ncbi:ATP-dependent DNA ligase [Streptomyces sp. IBSBF 3010]|uniref:ATP-dependent DNA ligase n=1 Tax=Streptomyces sp. IBSBF 3010 TaxID=2903526 RepID=UPI002FDC722A
MTLNPPLEPMLAQARDAIPRPGPGGAAAELKFDGYRALLFTTDARGGGLLVQSRHGTMLQSRFPDLVAAAGQLPSGLVLDGELVVLDENGQLSFPALQRRAATVRGAQALAAALPAHFITFDVLQVEGRELLDKPYAARRALLEALFVEHGLTPPWTLCPSTTDMATAAEWLNEWTRTPGIEGIVIKSLTGRYRPGVRGWTKVRRRETSESIIGGVTGSLQRPNVLLLGRYDNTGRLRLVGKTVPLKPAAAQDVAALLTPADPDHPWTGARFTARWGSRDLLDPVLVAPEQVAEVSADTAQDHGVWRHPVRYIRVRQDVPPEQVPKLNKRPLSGGS